MSSAGNPTPTWPAGISGAGVACGIKGGELDLGVLVAEQTATWAGTFTRNAAAAACVHWNRQLLGRPARAVVCNSGNANACTGADGCRAVEATAVAAARATGCDPTEVLVASTGPIGVALDVERLIAALPTAIAALSPEVGPFAASILTTDTTTKVARAGAEGAEVVGVAKGAAMLAPNMATMLAFITTDAEIDHFGLQDGLERAVDASFNRICIDACESTNDTVACLATGRARVGRRALDAALEEVCTSLSEQIARDAEGGTRLVRITVTGASDEQAAATLGRAVAASALWRAAVHGADPNWGRVAAALGAVDRALDLGRLSIAIGPELLFAKGEPVGSPGAVRRTLASDEVTVTCTVGEGPASVQVLSADLSPEYVTLNAYATT